MIEVQINHKWPLKLPDSAGNEWIGNMDWHDEWEGPRLNRLHQLITAPKIVDTGLGIYVQPVINGYLEKFPGPVVMYIGAYKGDMAALLATWGAQLILVEATEGFWPEIKETWELNDLPKPLAMFSGLISRSTTTEQIDFSDWPERSTPFIEGTTGFAHLAESGGYFPEITIDDLIKRTGIMPDLITMDIEGSELEALYGGLDTIINHRPDWLISVHPEFMFHNHGTYERELHDVLRNNKYIGKWLDYDHEHHWYYSKP